MFYEGDSRMSKGLLLRAWLRAASFDVGDDDACGHDSSSD